MKQQDWEELEAKAFRRSRTTAAPIKERDIAKRCNPIDSVYVRLTKGFVAVVDREFEFHANLRWSAMYRRSNNGNVRVYAVRQNKRIRYLLHKEVFRVSSGLDVDHIDGDTLNCRLSNLRAATRSQNNANATKRQGTSSQWKGVHFNAQAQKWNAQIRKRHLGQFYEECDAALAYNFAAAEDYGDFAKFNLP